MIDDETHVAPDPSPVRQPPPAIPEVAVPVQTSDEIARHNELVAVMATPEGRAVINRILDHCHIHGDNAALSEYARGVLEGERRVGVWITRLIQSLDAYAYANLMRYRADEAVRREATERNRQALEDAAKARIRPWERFKRYMSRTSQ